MAELVQQQVLPAPFIEAGGKTFLDMLTSAVGQYGSADLSKIFGPQFIAGQDPLQAQAQTLATQGIGAYKPFLQAAAASTGPGAYKQFMSPYQQDVIDTTIADFDVQAQKVHKVYQQQQLQQVPLVVVEKVYKEQSIRHQATGTEQVFKLS